MEKLQKIKEKILQREELIQREKLCCLQSYERHWAHLSTTNARELACCLRRENICEHSIPNTKESLNQNKVNILGQKITEKLR